MVAVSRTQTDLESLQEEVEAAWLLPAQPLPSGGSPLARPSLSLWPKGNPLFLEDHAWVVASNSGFVSGKRQYETVFHWDLHILD